MISAQRVVASFQETATSVEDKKVWQIGFDSYKPGDIEEPSPQKNPAFDAIYRSYRQGKKQEDLRRWYTSGWSAARLKWQEQHVAWGPEQEEKLPSGVTKADIQKALDTLEKLAAADRVNDYFWFGTKVREDSVIKQLQKILKGQTGD